MGGTIFSIGVHLRVCVFQKKLLHTISWACLSGLVNQKAALNLLQ